VISAYSVSSIQILPADFKPSSNSLLSPKERSVGGSEGAPLESLSPKEQRQKESRSSPKAKKRVDSPPLSPDKLQKKGSLSPGPDLIRFGEDADTPPTSSAEYNPFLDEMQAGSRATIKRSLSDGKRKRSKDRMDLICDQREIIEI
jgi:hypothetical protein